MIYDLTIDDAWYDDIALKDVVEGLNNLKVRPTVRMVMSKEMKPEEYVKLFKSIKPHADIMACPVDFSEMKNFKDRESCLQKYKYSYKCLSQYMNIWEVRNENNGTEWIKQKPEFIVEKISSAVDFIKRRKDRVNTILYRFTL